MHILSHFGTLPPNNKQNNKNAPPPPPPDIPGYASASYTQFFNNIIIKPNLIKKV